MPNVTIMLSPLEISVLEYRTQKLVAPALADLVAKQVQTVLKELRYSRRVELGEEFFDNHPSLSDAALIAFYKAKP